MLLIHPKYHKCQELYLGYDLYMYGASVRLAREAKYECCARRTPQDCAVMQVMVN